MVSLRISTKVLIFFLTAVLNASGSAPVMPIYYFIFAKEYLWLRIIVTDFSELECGFTWLEVSFLEFHFHFELITGFFFADVRYDAGVSIDLNYWRDFNIVDDFSNKHEVQIFLDVVRKKFLALPSACLVPWWIIFMIRQSLFYFRMW